MNTTRDLRTVKLCGATYAEGVPPCRKPVGHEHGPETDWKRHEHSSGTGWSWPVHDPAPRTATDSAEPAEDSQPPGDGGECVEFCCGPTTEWKGMWHVRWCSRCWPDAEPVDVTATDPGLAKWLDETERLVGELHESLANTRVADVVDIAVHQSEASRMFGAELVAELLDGAVLCLTIHPPGVTCELDERICVLAARYDPAEGRAARARWDALVAAADMGEHIRRELVTLEVS